MSPEASRPRWRPGSLVGGRPASATSPGWTCSIRSTRTVASQSPVAVSVVIFEPSTTASTRWRLSGSRSSSEAIASKPFLVASFGRADDERAMVRLQSWSRSGGGGGEGDDRPCAAWDDVAHGGSRHHWTGRRAARGALTGAGPHRGGPPHRGQRPPSGTFLAIGIVSRFGRAAFGADTGSDLG